MLVAAHPRAGGENRAAVPICAEAWGSSPRGRGKLLGLGADRDEVRLIPARAGKTGSRQPPRARSTAHPRAGGENHAVALDRVTFAGSSPRGRGKPHCEAEACERVRLIPARAGKTRDWSTNVFEEAAHPRAGGENPFRMSAVDTPAGSSPRGRGKQAGLGGDEARLRLIPARAGKTRWRALRSRAAAAHPRAGGENRTGGAGVFVAAGSSPRGRGKLDGRPGDRWHQGLIPARAGKTMKRSRRMNASRAHPRAGGENGRLHGLDEEGAGSSPRGRGKPDLHVGGRR